MTLVELEDLVDVFGWPTFWRRLFLFTLPVSGLLWLAYVALWIIICLILIPICGTVLFVAGIWNGKNYFND